MCGDWGKRDVTSLAGGRAFVVVAVLEFVVVDRVAVAVGWVCWSGGADVGSLFRAQCNTSLISCSGSFTCGRHQMED